MDNNLASKLLREGMSNADLHKADALIKNQSYSLMAALEEIRKIPTKKLLGILASYYGVKSVDLSSLRLQPSVTGVISAQIAESLRVIPIERVGANLVVATGDPDNISLSDKLRFETGYFVKLVLASEEAISSTMRKLYNQDVKFINIGDKDSQKTSEKGVERHKISTMGAVYDNEVIELVDKIILQAYKKGASDIHIETYEKFVRVRIRVDGSLLEIARISSNARKEIVARVKILCNMDIAESRLPQDQNLGITIDGVDINFRCSTMPSAHGEKVVLRLLDSSSLMLSMEELGFEKNELDAFRKCIHSPWGIVLVTGPTGSGKTTTLYSALSELNTVEENILTAEDPIEYNIEGINQVQTKNKIDLDFARILKTFLRQDPDIIMVGEIRDFETASIAINASLTGHLVLSTLHTNSSYETVTRLLSMGVKAYNLVGSLLCVIAQRLMRKLCMNCRVVDRVPVEQIIDLGVSKDYAHKIKVYDSTGCQECNGLGMKGRISIFELLKMTDGLYKGIIDGLSGKELKQIGISAGMRTLRQSALIKMARGVVSISEVERVTNRD